MSTGGAGRYDSSPRVLLGRLRKWVESAFVSAALSAAHRSAPHQSAWYGSALADRWTYLIFLLHAGQTYLFVHVNFAQVIAVASLLCRVASRGHGSVTCSSYCSVSFVQVCLRQVCIVRVFVRLWLVQV